MRIWSIGHSTRSFDELVALLRESDIALLVDVRTVPRSRRNPQFNGETLGPALAEQGIGYRRLPALGGLRHRSKNAGPSPNGLWRNESFRNYADYAMSPEFRAGLHELRELGEARPSAMMCAEALWWRCHRRIVADYLIASGAEVFHILGPAAVEPGSLTPGAEPSDDGAILYPPRQPFLL